jgi:RHS repeat-associated protein
MPVTSYISVGGRIISEVTDGVILDYVPDALGSIHSVIDQDANVLKTMRYKPYGEVLSRSGTVADRHYQWAGTYGYRATFAPSSSHYVRARHYTATAGSWSTVDPLWPDESAYGYVNGRSTRSVDPTGTGGILEWIWGLLNPPVLIHPGPPSPPPWREPPGPIIDPSPTCRFLIGAGQVKNFNYFTWEWGNCCGLGKKCGPGKSNGSCADDACEKHDKCVGPSWPGAAKWVACAAGLCASLQKCYDKLGCRSQIRKSSECQAAFEAGTAFCLDAGKVFRP